MIFKPKVSNHAFVGWRIWEDEDDTYWGHNVSFKSKDESGLDIGVDDNAFYKKADAEWHPDGPVTTLPSKDPEFRFLPTVVEPPIETEVETET